MSGINRAGINLLHAKEDCILHAYPDPYSKLGIALREAGRWKAYLRAPFPIPEQMRHLSGAPWTIGWGFTEGVKEGDRTTRQEADRRFDVEVAKRVAIVKRLCTLEPNENELAALVCLVYNIGESNFRTSTVLRRHNAGDKAAAARAFRLFNMAQGKRSDGLEQRRIAESQLYLTPVASAVTTLHQQAAAATIEEPVVSAQQVDPESKLTQSPMNRAGAVAAGTATVATVTEVGRGIADLKYTTSSLGDWLVPALLVVVIVMIGFMIYQRYQQRKGGWS